MAGCGSSVVFRDTRKCTTEFSHQRVERVLSLAAGFFLARLRKQPHTADEMLWATSHTCPRAVQRRVGRVGQQPWCHGLDVAGAKQSRRLAEPPPAARGKAAVASACAPGPGAAVAARRLGGRNGCLSGSGARDQPGHRACGTACR